MNRQRICGSGNYGVARIDWDICGAMIGAVCTGRAQVLGVSMSAECPRDERPLK
jgi:hypothetical protein